MSTAIQKIEHGIVSAARTPDDVRRQVGAIQNLMQDVMQDGVHYGIIPGVEKPTLYKSGAEKLNFLFRFVAEYRKESIDMPNGHFRYEYKCRLLQPVVLSDGSVQTRPDGEPVYVMAGEGDASCSSMESKYRYRNAARVCPACGKETIIKGKAEYGGGWLCWAKKGGCNAKYKDGDDSIEKQTAGKIENEDIEDVRNTVMKMAEKRALVAATLNATAASDIYTQDVEDMPQFASYVDVTPEPEPKPETHGTMEVEIPAPAKPAPKESKPKAPPETMPPIAEFASREGEYPLPAKAIKKLGDPNAKHVKDIPNDKLEKVGEWAAANGYPDLAGACKLYTLPF